MYLTQFTDAQLIGRITMLTEEILACSQQDYIFDSLSAQHDAVVEELRNRGLWAGD